MKALISSDQVPAPSGPYSPGLTVGEWIFLSGQGGFDPNTGKVVSDDLVEQTEQTFHNIETVLRAAGASRDDVISHRCRLHRSEHALRVTRALAERDKLIATNKASSSASAAAQSARGASSTMLSCVSVALPSSVLSTAIPSTPPNSKADSLIAAAVAARGWATEPKVSSVALANALPQPAPNGIRQAHSSRSLCP